MNIALPLTAVVACGDPSVAHRATRHSARLTLERLSHQAIPRRQLPTEFQSPFQRPRNLEELDIWIDKQLRYPCACSTGSERIGFLAAVRMHAWGCLAEAAGSAQHRCTERLGSVRSAGQQGIEAPRATRRVTRGSLLITANH